MEHSVGHHNVHHEALVGAPNVYLPPLHIKLGPMTNFVMAMNKNADAFQYLKKKFGAMKIDAKLKAEVFGSLKSMT